MKEYRICLVGYGNIARHLSELLRNRKDFLREQYNLGFTITSISDLEGSAVAARDASLDETKLAEIVAKRGSITELAEFSPGLTSRDAIELTDADILIELTPTKPQDGQPALDHMLLAFQKGMHVVTANKGPLVTSFRTLLRASERAGKMLKFGCATAAALPTTNVAYYDLTGCQILGIRGILNGTSNYILTTMVEERLEFASALEQAQIMGIAEQDPSLDIEGIDTAIKLTILANALYNVDLTLRDAEITGIRHLSAAEVADAFVKGTPYKLIGSAIPSFEGPRVSGVTIKVAPEPVPSSDPLANVTGTAKGVVFSTDLMGSLFVSGGNSSPTGAAAAILRDLINLSREENRS